MKDKMSCGNLFKAKENVLCWDDNKKIKRPTVVLKDEIVEFRYEHNAHFRIDDFGVDKYLFLTTEDFIKSFDHFAVVYEKVRFKNRNSMKQIIECKLYDEA